MEIFVKEGLYNKLYEKKVLKILEKSKTGIYFDVDFKINFNYDFGGLSDAVMRTTKGDAKMILNIRNIANSCEYRYIAEQLKNLISYLDKLIVTSTNDYFTLRLKREVKLLEEYFVNFAFVEEKNMEDNDYLICSSASSHIFSNNTSKIILNDSSRGIGSIIYDRNNKKEKVEEILIKSKSLF